MLSRLTFRVGADRGGTSGQWYTGYLPSFDFLDDAELAWRDGVLELYLHMEQHVLEGNPVRFGPGENATVGIQDFTQKSTRDERRKLVKNFWQD